jgi:hypothetical protein
MALNSLKKQYGENEMATLKDVKDQGKLTHHFNDSRPPASGIGNSGVTPTRNSVPTHILPQALQQAHRDKHGKTGTGKLLVIRQHTRHQGSTKSHR